MKATQFLRYSALMGTGIVAMTKTSGGKVTYHFEKPERCWFPDGSYYWGNDYSRNAGRGLHDPNTVITFPDGCDGVYRAKNGRRCFSYIGEYGWLLDLGEVGT